MVGEKPNLRVVLSMHEVDATLVDDVVQHVEVGGIAGKGNEVAAVGFGAHEQKLVRVGPDEIERFRREAQRAHEVRRRCTTRASDEDPLQRRASGLVWSIGAMVARPRLCLRSRARHRSYSFESFQPKCLQRKMPVNPRRETCSCSNSSYESAAAASTERWTAVVVMSAMSAAGAR